MKKALIFLLLLSGTHAFATEQYKDWWQSANKLYDQKEYDSARWYYEKIAALNPAEAAVYFNLGNTYYRLNDIGKAVLNYEKALKLQPGNKETEDNLSLAQSRINNRIYAGTDIFFIKWWKSVTDSEKAGTWAVISLAFFLALIGIAIAGKLNVVKPLLPPQATGIGWSICVLCMVLAFVSAKNKADRTRAVVMQNDSPFYASPQQTKAQAYVPEGTTVHFDSENGGWVEVTLPDGRSGWMQLSVLSKV